MSTLALFSIALLALVGGLVLFRIIPAVQTYFTYRGKRLITPGDAHDRSRGCGSEESGCWNFRRGVDPAIGSMLALAGAPGLQSSVSATG